MSPPNVWADGMIATWLALALVAPQPATLPAWALGPFERPPRALPLIRPRSGSSFVDPMTGRPVRWEALHTFNPAAVVKDGEVWLYYRAEDDSGERMIGGHTSRIGLARSPDGLSRWIREPEPVLFPAQDDLRSEEWPGGCEDPRVVWSDDGQLVMTYTRWDRKTARLGVATSLDGLRWTKRPRALQGPYGDRWSKSGSIVCRLDGERMVATKLGGKYWMYWGENPIMLAHSEDLMRWTVVEEAPGKPLAVLSTRRGRFDSDLTEPGPPALLTDQGILLLYNGKNAQRDGDRALPAGTYAGGQALLDPSEPWRVRFRLDRPFIQPELPWERTGQYKAGTAFIQGLVRHQGRWLLYYGCADSYVGVAMSTAG